MVGFIIILIIIVGSDHSVSIKYFKEIVHWFSEILDSCHNIHSSHLATEVISPKCYKRNSGSGYKGFTCTFDDYLWKCGDRQCFDAVFKKSDDDLVGWVLRWAGFESVSYDVGQLFGKLWLNGGDDNCDDDKIHHEDEEESDKDDDDDDDIYAESKFKGVVGAGC